MKMSSLRSLIPNTLRGPLGWALLLILGVGLMVGTPLLAMEGTEQSQTDHHGDDHGKDAHGAAGDDHHATDSHGDGHGDGQSEGHGEDHGGAMHFPTLVRLVADVFEPGDKELHGYEDATNPVARFLWRYEDVIYSGLLILFLWILFGTASKNMTLIPGKLQNFAEFLVEGLDNFVKGVIGEQHGRHFVPFLGTLGIYIYLMNIFGLVPLMKSPTSVLNTTAAMAICVFLYVQFTSLRLNGIGGHLYHLAGEPKDALGWAMVPLMFPLHVIGEFAKPISLSLRLFGNVMGEDLLLVVFVGLGIGALGFLGLPEGFPGIPLHLPFMFLALLTTFIQALVFTLLSTIYIALVMPHDEHH